MEKRPTILIADRNRNVREFLKREMASENYNVRLAKNCEEVLEMLNKEKMIDLLILDLDLPDSNEVRLLKDLQQQFPTLPIVVHTFVSEYATHPVVLSTSTFVEKKGSSVEGLKKIVSDLLLKSQPQPGSVPGGIYPGNPEPSNE